MLIIFCFCSCSSKTSEDENIKSGNKIEKEVIKVGFFETPPFIHIDESGKKINIIENIVKKTLDETGLEYVIKTYPPNRFYDYLERGEIDIAPSLNIFLKSNDKVVIGPKIWEIQMYIYKIGEVPKISKKEDLVGKTVILKKGFKYGDWGKWIRNPKNGVNIIENKHDKILVKLLKEGRGEYLLNYKNVVKNILKVENIKDIKEKYLFSYNVYFIFSKKIPKIKGLLKEIEKSYFQLVKAKKIFVPGAR